MGGRGLRFDGKSHKMEYGTAFHHALQEYYTTGDTTKAVTLAVEHYTQDDIVVPDNDFRDIGHLIATLHQYFTTYSVIDGLRPALHDGKPLLEQRFAVPYYTDGKLLDVVLCGTVDMIGTFNGINVIIDHKTTALTQVSKYLDAYQNSPQMMFYSMIYKQLFPDEDRGVVINGIFLNRTGKSKFQRSTIITFPAHVIEEFTAHLHNVIMGFVDSLRGVIADGKDPEEMFLPNFNCCQTKFGECNFSPVCTTPRRDDRETLVTSLFTTTNTYDPLKFQL